MNSAKLSKEEKAAELKKYRDLVMTTLDYWLHTSGIVVKTADFDSNEYLTLLKTQTEEHFLKGRLTRLKQWFRDLTEPYIETKDLGFNKYLRDKTGYDIDIFKSYFDRVEKIIAKGAITTDSQFYDLGIMVDQLCQIEPVDEKRISQLNKLLVDYENRKSRKKNRLTPFKRGRLNWRMGSRNLICCFIFIVIQSIFIYFAFNNLSSCQDNYS